MKKLTLIVAALTIAMLSYGQTQCSGTTTKVVQCKMDVGKEAGLCRHHDPNYVKVEDDGTTTVVCSGTTKAGNKCKWNALVFLRNASHVTIMNLTIMLLLILMMVLVFLIHMDANK